MNTKISLLLVALAALEVNAVSVDQLRGTTSGRCSARFTAQTQDEGVDYESQYFNSDEYDALTATEKMTQLWQQHLYDTTTADFKWSAWGDLFNQDMTQSFRDGDEMPRDSEKNIRVKLAHQQGVLAQVSWVPIDDANGYSGFFAEGSDNILMRLSETDMLSTSSYGLKPSVAFKLLRDGEVSDNIVAMPSFSGSGSWNFFENAFRTRVDPFEADTCPDLTIKKVLNAPSSWPFSCGFSRIAEHTESGDATGDVIIPFELLFEVNEPYKSLFDSAAEYDTDGSQVSWMDQMARIESGVDLMTVNALTSPSTVDGYAVVPIGTIRLNTTMQRSKFGDERLFFGHMNMVFDRQYYPTTWKRADEDPKLDNTDEANLWTYGVPEMDSSGGWPSDDAGAQTMWDQQINDHGCPFYWLLEHAGLA